jgi:hypothetical protein
MPSRKNEHDRLTLVYALALSAIAALYRLAPYGYQYLLEAPAPEVLWNLMPVGALALFAGSRLRTRFAWLLPVAVMFISDLLLIVPIHWLTKGQYSALGWGRPLIYASFLAYALLGRLVGPREGSPLVIGGAALIGSLQFFLVSNFGVWLGSPTHPQTLSGLMGVYALGLPFYKNTVVADLAFSGLFFAAHAALVYGADLRQARQPA